MNVSLTPRLEELVKQKVGSGLYRSSSEVIREALRLLEERDRRLASLRKDIAVGIEQIEQGEYTDYEGGSLGDLFDQVKAEGTNKLEAARRDVG